MTDFSKYQAKITTPTQGSTDFSKYGTVSQAQAQPETKGVVGTLLSPTIEGVQGLKTLYGGGEQGIASKIYQDIQGGVSALEQSAAGTKNPLVAGTNIALAGGRVAGDVAGAIYAPVGAAIGATGIGKVFDWIGQQSQKGGKYNPLNALTDQKSVQDFVAKNPNLEEDFTRAMNLVFAGTEKGNIDPKTVIPRTLKQVEYTQNLIKNVPTVLQDTTKKVFGNTNEDIVNKRATELSQIESQYAKMRKTNEFSNDGGDATRKRVSSTDVLVDSVDENGVIRTKQPGGAVEQYTDMTLNNAENVVLKNLERLGETIQPDTLSQYLKKAVEENPLIKGDAKTSALAKIDKEIAGYTRDANGNIPLTEVQLAKIATYKVIKDFATPAEYKTYQKALGEGLKTAVEKTSSFNTNEVNTQIGKYLSDIKYLEALDGARVKGGKLGKYFAQISGNIVGGIAGSAIGGMPGSAVGSIVGGELASKIKSSSMQRTLGGKTGMVAPKNSVIDKAVTTGNSPRLALPQPAPGSPKIQIGSGDTINLPKRTMSFSDYIYENSLGNR